MDLRHADLARLHVNRRDLVSQLSARIVANAGGRSLDDPERPYPVTDARYKIQRQGDHGFEYDHGRELRAEQLVELRSDFADATFRSKTSYRTVFEPAPERMEIPAHAQRRRAGRGPLRA